MTDVSYEIIVVAYRSRLPLTAFLETLGSGPAVLVVNNSSEDDDLADLSVEYPNVRILDAKGNIGYSAGCNLGARNSAAAHLIFMNPDTLPKEAELSRMVDVVKRSPDVASCGAAGVGTAGGGAQPTVLRTLVHSIGLHRILPTLGIYFHPSNGEEVEAGWISGSCLAIDAGHFDSVGGFDESYFVFMSDFDLGAKLKGRHLTQVLHGGITVQHVDGGSSDIPPTWTWEQRGKGWAQFLRRKNSNGARLMAATLIAGFDARWALYTVARKTSKAEEVRTYARSLAREWRST